ncbi:MAG TPA: hypothetical protein PLH72_13870 [Vicinamibacterales bacterium]|nr:hypothetical protein [Vicinamibacterales bacterium]
MSQTGMVRVLGMGRVVTMAAVMALGAQSASAQFRPAAPPAIGEDYHVEVSYGWWDADPSLIVNSESLGILGTDVDLVTDLGIEKKRLGKLDIVLRPAIKHKFRIEYLPIKYAAETVIQREFVFNGQRYRVGLPVNTNADFKTYRFGYEYDFVHRSRGFAGVLFDVKYTDVNIELLSPIGPEYTTAVAPIPTIGFVGRGYVARNVAIGGEVSFFKVPDNLSEDYEGKYTDIDVYGTVNFTNNVGATVGYRSVDVFYRADNDTGTLKFKGLYLSGVIRF